MYKEEHREDSLPLCLLNSILKMRMESQCTCVIVVTALVQNAILCGDVEVCGHGSC